MVTLKCGVLFPVMDCAEDKLPAIIFSVYICETVSMRNCNIMLVVLVV